MNHNKLLAAARLSLTLSLALLLIATAAPTALGASPAGPALTGNVTEIASPAAFYASAPQAQVPSAQRIPSNPRYWVASGTADSSGNYHYPVALQASTNGPAVVRELSIDPATHRELLVTGNVTSVQVQSATGASTGGQSGGTRAGPSVSSGGVSPMFATPGYAWHYMYTAWYDPVEITLSSAYDESDIWWNSSAVMTSWAWYYKLWWNTNNSWKLNYHNSFAQILTGNQGLAALSYASMSTSSPFPSPTCGTTTTYYWPNEVYTYIGGHIFYSVDTWASSGCLFMIHWEYYVG